jgi:protease-4
MFNRNKAAVIRFSGAITAQSVSPYLKLLKKIEKDKHIKGIMFVIDSPGGSAIHSELLYLAIRRLKNKGKKIYGYLEFAASGGYMIACALDKLYAPSTAVVGSIGVISIKPVLKEILEKIGIGYEVIKKGKHKDMWLFTRNYSEEERESISGLQEEIYNRFIEIVSEGRKIPASDVLSLATGELFSTKKSLGYKLIDKVCGFDDALEELCAEIKANPDKAVKLSIKKPFFQRIIGASVYSAIEDIYYRAIL